MQYIWFTIRLTAISELKSDDAHVKMLDNIFDRLDGNGLTLFLCSLYVQFCRETMNFCSDDNYPYLFNKIYSEYQ